MDFVGVLPMGILDSLLEPPKKHISPIDSPSSGFPIGNYKIISKSRGSML